MSRAAGAARAERDTRPNLPELPELDSAPFVAGFGTPGLPGVLFAAAVFAASILGPFV